MLVLRWEIHALFAQGAGGCGRGFGHGFHEVVHCRKERKFGAGDRAVSRGWIFGKDIA